MRPPLSSLTNMRRNLLFVSGNDSLHTIKLSYCKGHLNEVQTHQFLNAWHSLHLHGHQYSDISPIKTILWMRHCHVNSIFWCLTLNTVIVTVSNNQIKMWSILVLVPLLYTCTHLNRTMPCYQSFHSILQQWHIVYGRQTAWRRILELLAASLRLASEEKTTDSTF